MKEKRIKDRKDARNNRKSTSQKLSALVGRRKPEDDQSGEHHPLPPAPSARVQKRRNSPVRATDETSTEIRPLIVDERDANLPVASNGRRARLDVGREF